MAKPWTTEEDEALLGFFDVRPKRWAWIAEQLTDRCPGRVFNRGIVQKRHEALKDTRTIINSPGWWLIFNFGVHF